MTNDWLILAATEKNEIDAVRCLCLAGLDLSITNKVS